MAQPASRARVLAHAPVVWLLALLLAAVGTPAWAQEYRFSGVERVVAVGDVHGSYPEFVQILKEAGVVDPSLRWSGGRTHFVSTGDLFSRGDQALKVIELLMRLQDEARAAGGQVHVVLGNHEVMSMTGDLRYVTTGEFATYATAAGAAADAAAGAKPGQLERMKALAPDGRIGRWLLQRPVMIIINDDVFVHGGLSDKLLGLSLEQINRSAIADVRGFAEGWQALIAGGALKPTDDFDRILATAKAIATAPVPEGAEPSPLKVPAARIEAAVNGLPFQSFGPVWYRGSSLCHPYSEGAVAAQVLSGLGAKRMVVGHTPTLDHRISSRLEGRVTRIDTGMNKAAYDGVASALVLERGRRSVVYAGAGRAEVREEANREWPRPHGMTDAQIEEFLLNAPITLDEELDLGVTKPHRLTLERDGQRMRAVFKTYDSDPGAERGRWSRTLDKADRYQYEVAAYKLDRVLGLQMVPVAVVRKVGKDTGLVQYWVEKSTNETDRIQKNIAYDSDCSFKRLHDLINAFDVLVHNLDRNTGNILYDGDWRAWLIDHSRSFSTEQAVPPELHKTAIVVTPQLAQALAKVTRANLAPLSPYLHPKQIDALVSRAAALRAGKY